MYIVMDVEAMMKTKHPIRKRQKPAVGFQSTLLLRPGTDISIIPPGSEIRYAYGSWEVHMPISNTEIIKRLAAHLDAIAWMKKE